MKLNKSHDVHLLKMVPYKKFDVLKYIYALMTILEINRKKNLDYAEELPGS